MKPEISAAASQSGGDPHAGAAQVAAQLGDQAALEPARRQREAAEPQRELAQRLRSSVRSPPHSASRSASTGAEASSDRHRRPQRERRTAARPAAAAARRRARTAEHAQRAADAPDHEPPRAARAARPARPAPRTTPPKTRRLDRLRPGLAARAVEREPAVADLLQRDGDGQPAEQHDRAAPLVAEHEHDQVGAEQREPGAERERPHQRQPVRLREQLLEHVAAVADAHDRRVDRRREDLVGAVGVAGQRRGQRDRSPRRPARRASPNTAIWPCATSSADQRR